VHVFVHACGFAYVCMQCTDKRMYSHGDISVIDTVTLEVTLCNDG